MAPAIVRPFNMENIAKNMLVDLSTYWRVVLVIVVPIVLSPLPIVAQTPAAYCAYIVLIMIVYWVTEVLPMAIIALFPLFLFPLFGIVRAKVVSQEYIQNTSWIFMASLMMALAVEKSQLHHRVGLILLTKIGSSPRRLMLGFMVSTCFLSMWLSNTATTAMMVPLALGVIDELTHTKAKRKSYADGQALEDAVHQVEGAETVSRAATATLRKKSQEVAKIDQMEEEDGDGVDRKEHFEKIRKGLLLSICYAANIGGTGTLTGSSTNLVVAGQLQGLFPDRNTGINYGTWMAFSLPQMLVILLLAWLWLQVFFIGFTGCTKKQSEDELAIEAVLKRKYNELKPMSFGEKAVSVLFVVLVLLWLTRDPGNMAGWGHWFIKDYVNDATVAIAISALLFVVPRELTPLAMFTGEEANGNRPSVQTLLTWDHVQKELPWGIVLLLGGGFAMAAGVKQSGLDEWISGGFSKLDGIPHFAFVIICVILITFLTEFTSNIAVASIFVPIGVTVAQHMHFNPLYVVLPIGIAASFAFMLPVATPPNAIVFGTGAIRLFDMVLSGFMMNLICMAVLLLNINTYGCWVVGCHTYPNWAEKEANVSLPIVLLENVNETMF